MVLKFFKRPLPSILFTIVLIGVLSWTRNLFGASEVVVSFNDYPMPLFILVATLLPSAGIWSKLIALLLVTVNGLLLIQLNTKFILIKNRTHLPALFYIAVCSAIVPLQGLNPALFAAFFAILAIDSIFSTLEQNPLDGTFKAGFFIALSTLFYLPSVSLLLVLFFAITILNLNGLRPWLSSLFGFLIPVSFAFFFFYYLKDNFALLETIQQVYSTSSEFGFGGLSIPNIIVLSFFALLLVVSSVFLLSSLPTQKISVRKYYSIFLWMIVFVGVVTALFSAAGIEMVFLFTVPFSFLLSTFFTFSRSRFWPETLFILLLLITLFIQIA